MKSTLLLILTLCFSVVSFSGCGVLDNAVSGVSSIVGLSDTATVIAKTGYDEADVLANITANLQALFALVDEEGAPNPFMDFGANRRDQLLPQSDIINAIRDAEGVERVKPGTVVPAGDVALAYRDFPQLGTIDITFE